METRLRSVGENVVALIVLLVLVQTIVEDIAVVLGWGVTVRTRLMISAFVFDVLFTIEFLSRLFLSTQEGDTRGYLLRQRGWIDLLSSLPLLMFISGPAIVALLIADDRPLEPGALITGATFHAVRMLRLLRVLKLFRPRTDSVSASHRIVSAAATQSVSVLVSFGALFAFLTNLTSRPLGGVGGVGGVGGGTFNLLWSAVVLTTVAVFLFGFGLRLRKQVTTPLVIVARGMTEAAFQNLARVPPASAGAEIVTVTRAYNEVYLPMKMRDRASASVGGGR